MRVVLDYIGCRLNQAEIEEIAERLNSWGYEIVSHGQKADFYILNTCSVTGVAEAKCRHRLSRAKKFSPEATIIAFGCYARRNPQELKAARADLIVANSEEIRLNPLSVQSLPHPGWGRKTKRIRSFIKIQEGCNTPCSYCIVPKVRGRGKSFPPQNILAEIKSRYRSGYWEMVLTGTNIGRYRWDGMDFKGLLEKILTETEFFRIRVSSLQPSDITSELLSLWKDDMLAPHFHLPLQSGSDRILEKMKRGYSVEGFRQAVAKIKEVLPEASLTTDILVGFPGEGEEDFQATYNLCHKIGFAKLHVFPFSPRPGTPAYSWAKLPPKVVKSRVEALISLSNELSYRFKERQLGKVFPVLWESEVENGVYSGLTPHYLRVYVQSPKPLVGEISLVKISRLTEEGLAGELI